MDVEDYEDSVSSVACWEGYESEDGVSGVGRRYSKSQP